ncbi:MAG: hypothetical protein R3274_07830, partial [Desulfobacterales bacterium]|nr:hypothetical protein [Desulfobacterales bacterium]
NSIGMKTIVTLFALATILAGIIIVINPEALFGLLRRKLKSIGLHIMAVVVRVISGAALILYASQTRFPTAIYPWVYAIIAAAVLAMIGRARFRRLMSWALGLTPYPRVTSLKIEPVENLSALPVAD